MLGFVSLVKLESFLKNIVLAPITVSIVNLIDSLVYIIGKLHNSFVVSRVHVLREVSIKIDKLVYSTKGWIIFGLSVEYSFVQSSVSII